MQRDSGLSEDEKVKVIKQFELQCNKLRHKHCKCCHQVSLNLDVAVQGTKVGMCSNCRKMNNSSYYFDEKLLPIWFDDCGQPIYTVPVELQGLTTAEKLLIQRISPFVPLHHIKNGTMGLTGHVCAFEQDLDGFLTTMPRAKDNVSMLKVLKSMKTEIGSGKASVTKAYRVRKTKVLRALVWLKKYCSEYKDIVIDESLLDWIDGEEGELGGTIMQGMIPMSVLNISCLVDQCLTRCIDIHSGRDRHEGGFNC